MIYRNHSMRINLAISQSLTLANVFTDFDKCGS